MTRDRILESEAWATLIKTSIDIRHDQRNPTSTSIGQLFDIESKHPLAN